jgi:hypothetical protein
MYVMLPSVAHACRAAKRLYSAVEFSFRFRFRFRSPARSLQPPRVSVLCSCNSVANYYSGYCVALPLKKIGVFLEYRLWQGRIIQPLLQSVQIRQLLRLKFAILFVYQQLHVTLLCPTLRLFLLLRLGAGRDAWNAATSTAPTAPTSTASSTRRDEGRHFQLGVMMRPHFVL